MAFSNARRLCSLTVLSSCAFAVTFFGSNCATCLDVQLQVYILMICCKHLLKVFYCRFRVHDGQSSYGSSIIRLDIFRIQLNRFGCRHNHAQIKSITVWPHALASDIASPNSSLLSLHAAPGHCPKFAKTPGDNAFWTTYDCTKQRCRKGSFPMTKYTGPKQIDNQKPRMTCWLLF